MTTNIANRTQAVLPQQNTKIAQKSRFHGCFVFVIFALFCGKIATAFFKDTLLWRPVGTSD